MCHNGSFGTSERPLRATASPPVPLEKEGIPLNPTFRLLVSVFRIAYGGFFVIVGLYGGASLLSGAGNPFGGQSGDGALFQDALEATGFVVPLMLACFLLGGSALLSSRTAPLGIVILAPSVVVIFFYHLLLGGNPAWGAFWAGGLLLLAWRFRGAFAALVTFSD